LLRHVAVVEFAGPSFSEIARPADGDRRRSDRTVEVDACFREGAFD
jgi:hypothetical protein